MNYARFSSIEELIKASIVNVKPGWLYDADGHETLFMDRYKTTIEHIYTMSKFSKKMFCPQPDMILEPLKWMSPSEVSVLIIAHANLCFLVLRSNVTFRMDSLLSCENPPAMPNSTVSPTCKE